MRIVAYLYSDPLLEAPPDPALWGWDVDQVYQDLGGRQQWLLLLEESQADPIDYLLVRRWEELGDSAQELSARLSTLATRDIHLLVVEADADSPGSPGTKRVALLQLFQEMQRLQRSRQIRRGHARNRVKALPPPGRAPYGYRRGKERYVIDRSTAPIVKDFVEQFLLYGSLRGAVRHLEKKYGKKISPSTGQRWLTSPTYRGDLAYQNGPVIPNTHPAILSREEAAQVDRLLRRNRRLPPRSASAPRSLAGLVTCTTCQSGLTVSRVTAFKGSQKRQPTQEYLYLRPTGCTRQPRCKAIPYTEVLERTIQRICVDLPQAVAQATMPDLSGVQQSLTAAIAHKTDILQQLPELVAQGILDTETAELRAYRVRSELAELQGQLAQLPPMNLQAIAQTISLTQFWLDLSEAERRFYFREFLQQIQLVRHEADWEVQLVFFF